MELRKKITEIRIPDLEPSIQGQDAINNTLVTRPDGTSGFVKVKIEHQVFRVLCRKKRAGETVRMVIERAIMSL
jgi:hypothetical protein